MRYERIAAAFYGEPWAIELGKFQTICGVLARKRAGEVFDQAEIRLAASQRRDPMQTAGRGGVGLVTVFGTLAQRMGQLEESSGGCSCEEVGAALDKFAGDNSISTICIVFDSGGGSVYGIDELGRKIASIRARKPVIGVADSIAASAAYWLASQCSELVVTNGGSVGSIGVLAAHEDHSGEEKLAGVKTTLISAGPHKTEGNPYGPLADEARAEIQSKCDHYYGMFVAAVARGRGVSEAKVRTSFGGGRMLTAQQAVSVGAADRIATLQQVLTDITGGAKGPKAEAAARMYALKARAAQVSRETGGVAPAAAYPSPSGRTTLAMAQARARLVAAECEGAGGGGSGAAGRTYGTTTEAARRRVEEIERELRGGRR